MASLAEALIASARGLPGAPPRRKAEAEGGCGVLGLAASRRLPGRALLPGLAQMRNRGNGKGGGIAAAGLDPDFFGVGPETMRRDYLLAIAYVDPAVRAVVEATHIEPVFDVDHVTTLEGRPSPQRPQAHCYFARVRADVRERFRQEHGIANATAAEDEIVFQQTYRLNLAYYAACERQDAFVLSCGQDLLVAKIVGYGDEVIRHYGLGALGAHVWIGHHRYPTKGRVWHPGGAHPFAGVHEALVHNGDFANYAALCTYLAQRSRYPLFLTDTEIAALLFDLLHRVYGYPLEYAIEALAPTTERDLTLLPGTRQRVYRMLRAAHLASSPDGPWYFLVAQSRGGVARLIGVTDTSMLRPQVFALQHGEVGIGLAASERQAIDAVLEGLAAEDPRFWRRADQYWSARGGSHTDGGAFVFTAAGDRLECADKFGRPILVPGRTAAPGPTRALPGRASGPVAVKDRASAAIVADVLDRLPTWDEPRLREFLNAARHAATADDGRDAVLAVLTALADRRYPTGELRRSRLLAHLDECLDSIAQDVRRWPSVRYRYVGHREPLPEVGPGVCIVINARGFPSEGAGSLSRTLVDLHTRGGRRFLIVGVRGQRFIGCGLGPSQGVRIDVYGVAGDYLASGIDGAEIVVHGPAQDQVAQIIKDGKLVIHGDVGQTFLYAAKGGQVYVLGSAAGRPLINAVGSIRCVINGTCLDYLAESFMAGDPHAGGGFAVVNGVAIDDQGDVRDLPAPYPGGNLCSLASGGAVYLRDPRHVLTDDQLNGAEFTTLTNADWGLIQPCLTENERVFGVPVRALLTIDGQRLRPAQVYRKIRPVRGRALSPEEAWVRRKS